MPRSSEPLVYSVWTTAWGPMGAVASREGLTRVVLPHYMADDLRALLAFEHPGAVESADRFERLIEQSRDYFNGKPVAFDEIPCDLTGGAFSAAVLTACRAVPYGQTRSYREIAIAIGNPDGARAVAAALGRNPIPLVIPCHRVTYSDGGLGGYSAPGGVELKRRMLSLEKAL
ncbi:MAG TPA: methylated-DNA--[protein]-cysteine S-methyltransferase [Phycisphaerae bacterium]|nr:methylated-DNA--[protein]-cysteine S-methyltransferase [Phycisphaerae bacterium]